MYLHTQLHLAIFSSYPTCSTRTQTLHAYTACSYSKISCRSGISQFYVSVITLIPLSPLSLFFFVPLSNPKFSFTSPSVFPYLHSLFVSFYPSFFSSIPTFNRFCPSPPHHPLPIFSFSPPPPSFVSLFKHISISLFVFFLFLFYLVDTFPKESVGIPDQMTVSHHSKSDVSTTCIF